MASEGSIINGDAANEMEMILRQLQSSDNNARNQAEQAFNAARRQAGPCIVALAMLATGSEDVIVRDTAAVLLRRSAAELWGKTDEVFKTFVKKQLMQGIRQETRRDPRKKLCDTLGAVAATDADLNDLLPFMIDMANSPNAHERESSMYIFSQLTDFVRQKLEQHLASFAVIFEAGLKDPDVNIEVEALRATCSVLNTFSSDKYGPIGNLLPLMMQPVTMTLHMQDTMNSKLCIELLIECLENEPRCWRKYLEPYIELMRQVATTKSLDDDTRQLGLEFLVSAAEQLPKVCRKMSNYVEKVFPAALGMMLEVVDDPDWYGRDDDDDDDEFSNSELGQEALDRLAIKLGGKAILPVGFQLIAEYLNNKESWVHRHAALLAISQIGEGCQKEILEKLDIVAEMALSHFQDPHLRVRYAAVHCIGQMCTDFAPTIQETLHHQIVPKLIAAMDDTSQPRVQSHAAAAIINFCEEADSELIQLYMEPLLTRLNNLLHSPQKLIQEQAVTAVASVADTAGVKFQPYYDSFMPKLKKVLEAAAGQRNLSRLRGKVMECVSMIGFAVGRDMFEKDAADVMNVLVQTQKASLDPDDPQSYYLMQAYARICRCLKEKFIPYLAYVMPGLLEAASTQPQIEVLSALDDDEDDEGMETIIVGDKKIGIRTSALEDKATACNMIAVFASELKGGFIDYVDTVAQLMIPLLKFYYHDECRIAAAQCLPDLLICVAMQGEAGAEKHRELLNCILPELIKEIPSELDMEVMVTKVESLAEVIGAQSIQDPNLLKSCAACILEVLNERSERVAARRNYSEEDDFEPEDEGDLLAAEETDDELLDQVADVIVALVKSGGEHFLPIFEYPPNGQNLANVFSSMLAPDRPASERRVALTVFDDMIEYSGEFGLRYIPRLLPAMKAYATDENPEVKLAAAYGLGIAAEKGGEIFARNAGGISDTLGAVLRAPNARNEANETATDITISAIAKILQHQPSHLEPQADFAQALLTYLPMKADLTESVNVHERLVQFVESGNMIILGENFCNLGHILRIFAEVMDTNLMSKDFTVRAAAVLKSMQQQLPPQTLQGASQGLNKTQLAKIESALH